MDARVRGRSQVDLPAGAVEPETRIQSGRRLLATALLSTVMLGGAWIASWLSVRLGLPASVNLVADGRWEAASWASLPWLDLLGMLIFMFCIPLIVERRHHAPPPAIGFRAGRGAVYYLAVALLCALAAAAFLRPAGMGRMSRGSMSGLLAYWLVVALTEETAFRGVIQRRLTTLATIWVALPVTTALFILWHGRPESTDILALRAGAGLMLGLLYHLSRSLLPPITFHWLLNIVLNL